MENTEEPRDTAELRDAVLQHKAENGTEPVFQASTWQPDISEASTRVEEREIRRKHRAALIADITACDAVKLTTEEIARLFGVPRGTVAGFRHRHMRPKLPKGRRNHLPADGRPFSTCQWSDDDPKDPDFEVCGEPSKPGYSWCEKHYGLAFR